MPMAVIIVRNTTISALPLDNLNVENRVLPPGIEVNLTQYNKVYEIQADPQLQQYIESGQCIVNDGTRDLSQEEALNVAATVISTASIYNFTEAPEKVLVDADDLFLVEDSQDGYRKKSVKSSNVVFLGAGTIVYTPERFVETGIVYTKTDSPITLYGMEKTITDPGNYEVEFSGQFACLKGWEIVLVAIFVNDTMVPDTRRIIEAESYVAVSTDALIENMQVGQVLNIKWWTDRGKQVIAESRSMKVRKYV